MFEPFEDVSITTISTSDLNSVCKNGNTDIDLQGCITEANPYLTITKDNYIKASYYIPKLIGLMEPEKTTIADIKNHIDTFDESVKQQENPESTLTVQAQRTGPFAIPRPLTPIGIAALFGLAFVFLFISTAVLYAYLPTSSGSPGFTQFITFDVVKNLSIGILLVAVVFMALALAKVI